MRGFLTESAKRLENAHFTTHMAKTSVRGHRYRPFDYQHIALRSQLCKVNEIDHAVSIQVKVQVGPGLQPMGTQGRKLSRRWMNTTCTGKCKITRRGYKSRVVFQVDLVRYEVIYRYDTDAVQ